MRRALLIPMMGVAVALGGCANRLSTATQDSGAPCEVARAPVESYGSFVVVRTTSRPVTAIPDARARTYPAPPPPASVQVLRGPSTLTDARRLVIAPRGRPARVQPAVRAPCVPAPRRAKAAPAPCVENVLFTPSPDCLLDPCAGGRCAVPK